MNCVAIQCEGSVSIGIVEISGMTAMRQPIEISVELTAQELIDSPTCLVGSHDVCELTTLETHGAAVNAAPAASDSEFEIELTPDEIDALLEGRL